MTDLFDRVATFSEDRAHRYTLVRRVQPYGFRTVAFVMLNPSTADETNDDPTIRRCIAYARAWNFERLVVGNLFAFRATDPRDMKAAADPVGTLNDAYLVEIAKRAELVVCAWGQHGKHRVRADHVAWMMRRFNDLHALELSNDGTPKHPLYLRGDLSASPWRARRAAEATR